MAQIFEVDLLQLGAVSKALSEALKAERATEKEIRQTLLLVEEITVKFSMWNPDAPVTAAVSRRFGNLSVKLSPRVRSTTPSPRHRTGPQAQRIITAQ